jgi:gas vesicle protein
MDISTIKFREEAQRMERLKKSLEGIQEHTNPFKNMVEELKSSKGNAFMNALARQSDLIKQQEFPHRELESIKMHNIPTFEDTNNFQSAGSLLKKLATSIQEWRSALPENMQPVIIAILHGGVQIDVESLSQESFHGIRIGGKINGAACVLLAHQSTVQLLCILQEIKPPELPKRQIGFVINGQESKV